MKTQGQVGVQRVYRATGLTWFGSVVLHDSWWNIFSAHDKASFYK